MTVRLTSFGEDRVSNTVNRALRRLPGAKELVLSKYKDSAFAEPGTLNNQRRREEVVLHVIENLKPRAIVETGTYLGAGTKFFLSHTENCPILSCETQDFYHAFSAERFQGEPRVTIHKGSSPEFLAQIPETKVPHDAEALFYLDAHWEKSLPLRDEIQIILKRWPKALIMVDDFAVPNDKGYGYDNYGSAGVLNEEYLRGINENLRIFYPAVESRKETGAKRGTCYLCLPDTKANAILSGNQGLFVSSECLAQRQATTADGGWASKGTQPSNAGRNP